MATDATVVGADPDPIPTTGVPAEPPKGRGRPWFKGIVLGLVVLMAFAAVAGFVIHVPYTTIAPGEALSLPPLVNVQGAPTYAASRGDIRLLFVREASHVSLWRYVQGRLDSDIDIVKDTVANPGKLTPRQVNEEGLQQMADAKSSATVVALEAAGYKVGVEPGLVVSELFPDLPAIKTLHWGDVILTADGRTIARAADLTAAIGRHRAGQQVVLVVIRAGKKVTARVTIATDQGRKVVGVVVTPRFKFPFKVDVDTRDIGGPSAGLAMTLSIFDDLTPGNLTGGARVAVTGTIDPDGTVGEIGGIEQKAVAARAAGVTMLIAPRCSPDDSPPALASCKADLAAAATRAGSKIKVEAVATFSQALAVLRAAGGAPVTPSFPTTTTTIAA
jgi:PDZ domain-containing protein